MINKLLEKHIPSKHYLNYIKQNNITYSDYEVAAILSHCINDPFKLHEELDFISKNTKDEKLKKEIFKICIPFLEENKNSSRSVNSVNKAKEEPVKDEEYDLQKELEAKFDELFGPIDDD